MPSALSDCRLMPSATHISVAIPMMDELDNLDGLLSSLRRQSYRNFTTYVCVNQPEAWNVSDDEYRTMVVKNNAEMLRILDGVEDLKMVVIDRTTVGNGWTEKKQGVGWARKVLFDVISGQQVSDSEIIVSLDADTDFGEDYLGGVAELFESHADIGAVALPYYHPVTGNEAVDRRLLRYECYMRHYLMNMQAIGNPYAFTALGSAMAFTVAAYRKAGGITPLQGGEDFYLMQKFVKTGRVMVAGNDREQLVVRPQGRMSRRVPFGTGPAVAMTLAEQKEKYPFYKKEGFEAVRATYKRFEELYEHDVETPMSAFLKEQLRTDDLWLPLRRNYKSRELFVRACKERVDGLRILQYLRTVGGEEPMDFEREPIERIKEFREELVAVSRQQLAVSGQ